MKTITSRPECAVAIFEQGGALGANKLDVQCWSICVGRLVGGVNGRVEAIQSAGTINS